MGIFPVGPRWPAKARETGRRPHPCKGPRMTRQNSVEDGHWDAVPGTDLELQHRAEVRAGFSVLVVSLRLQPGTSLRALGVVSFERTRIARALFGAVDRASSAMVEPELAVLDATALADSSLFELLGMEIDCLTRPLAGRAWLWAASESS